MRLMMETAKALYLAKHLSLLNNKELVTMTISTIEP